MNMFHFHCCTGSHFGGLNHLVFAYVPLFLYQRYKWLTWSLSEPKIRLPKDVFVCPVSFVKFMHVCCWFEVGGCLLQGQLQSFQGLEAQISTDNGPVLIPAAVALKLAKSGANRIASPECQVQVPVAGVMAGMEAAKMLGWKKMMMLIVEGSIYLEWS